MTELLEEENTNLSTSHEHAHLISMYTSLNSLIFVSLSPCPPTPVFGLGLACQAKGHSNRIPTFRPCHVFTEITEKKKKKTRKSANHSLQSISVRFKNRPVETKIYFQLNMIVSFKFKRKTERYLILIVQKGLIENFEIR